MQAASTQTTTTNELVEAAKHSRAAFNRLAIETRNRLWPYIVGRAKNLQLDPEDLCQDFFCSFGKLVHSFDSTKGTWWSLVCGCIKRRAISLFRSERRHVANVSIEPDAIAGLVSEHGFDELMEIVLDPIAKQLLTLCFGQGFTLAEAAELLSLSPSQASRLKREALAEISRVLFGNLDAGVHTEEPKKCK